MQEDSSQAKGFVMVFGAAAAILLVLLIFGCGKRTDDATAQFVKSLTPVSGTVTQGDKPVGGVLVTYFVDQTTGISGSQSSGLTDESGRYTLITFIPGSGGKSAPGAVPGDYRVTITKLVLPNGDPVPKETTDADAEALGARQLLPSKYSSPTATKLSAKVNASETMNDFHLDK